MKHLNGEYYDLTFEGQCLRDCVLSGTFMNVDFIGCDLTNARLIGHFQDCDFSDADTTNAHINPTAWLSITDPNGNWIA